MDCLFCKICKGEIPSYKIYENEDVLCYLDINPTKTAHTLVVPKKHFSDALEMDNEIIIKINDALKEVVKIIDNAFKPNGYEFIVNHGICQKIKHYHLHIIPHYNNNFVINDLKEVHKKLIDSEN